MAVLGIHGNRGHVNVIMCTCMCLSSRFMHAQGRRQLVLSIESRVVVLQYSYSAIMPKERPSSRKERRKEQLGNYLAGRASRPYRHTPTLERSFTVESRALM